MSKASKIILISPMSILGLGSLVSVAFGLYYTIKLDKLPYTDLLSKLITKYLNNIDISTNTTRMNLELIRASIVEKLIAETKVECLTSENFLKTLGFIPYRNALSKEQILALISGDKEKIMTAFPNKDFLIRMFEEREKLIQQLIASGNHNIDSIKSINGHFIDLIHQQEATDVFKLFYLEQLAKLNSTGMHNKDAIHAIANKDLIDQLFNLGEYSKGKINVAQAITKDKINSLFSNFEYSAALGKDEIIGIIKNLDYKQQKKFFELYSDFCKNIKPEDMKHLPISHQELLLGGIRNHVNNSNFTSALNDLKDWNFIYENKTLRGTLSAELYATTRLDYVCYAAAGVGLLSILFLLSGYFLGAHCGGEKKFEENGGRNNRNNTLRVGGGDHLNEMKADTSATDLNSFQVGSIVNDQTLTIKRRASLASSSSIQNISPENGSRIGSSVSDASELNDGQQKKKGCFSFIFSCCGKNKEQKV